MRSDFSFNTAINFSQNDPGSRRSRRQRLDVWTIVYCVRRALGCGGRVWPIYRRVCCWRESLGRGFVHLGVGIRGIVKQRH